MPVIRIDDEVMREIKKQASKLDLVFSTPNDVLRRMLGLDGKVKAATVAKAPPSLKVSNDLPRSSVPIVQGLIDAIVPTIRRLEPNATFQPDSSGKRWIVRPNNFATLKPQDAQKKDLVITVFGRPDAFQDLKVNLALRNDQAGYSRFSINDNKQVPDTIKVIQRAHKLKQK